MNTSKTASQFSACIGLMGALLAAPALSAPGNAWDAFNVGQGDSIHSTSAYVGTSMGGSPGKSYDVFRAGVGEPVPAPGKGYMGTSQGTRAGQGWDLFKADIGERL